MPKNDLLNCWGGTRGTCVVSEAPRGFSGANVRRVESASGVFALRCWPAAGEGLPIARLRELHRWLGWLAADGGAVVAVPLHTDEGSTVVEHRGLIWQLEPWLPGTADFHARPTDERLRSAFAALARLHLASERYVSTEEGATWFRCGRGRPDAVSERLIRLQRTLARPTTGPAVDSRQRDTAEAMARAVAALAPRVAVELATNSEVLVPLHPCLRDVWHDHILFTGDAVTGIIDPSAARTESVASDLSRLLGSMLPGSLHRWPTAIDAYAAIRSLSDDERRLITVLDRSGAVLSAVYWLDRLQTMAANEREWDRILSLAARLTAFAAR